MSAINAYHKYLMGYKRMSVFVVVIWHNDVVLIGGGERSLELEVKYCNFNVTTKLKCIQVNVA